MLVTIRALFLISNMNIVQLLNDNQGILAALSLGVSVLGFWYTNNNITTFQETKKQNLTGSGKRSAVYQSERDAGRWAGRIDHLYHRTLLHLKKLKSTTTQP